jgi:hypothetical protein
MSKLTNRILYYAFAFSNYDVERSSCPAAQESPFKGIALNPIICLHQSSFVMEQNQEQSCMREEQKSIFFFYPQACIRL